LIRSLKEWVALFFFIGIGAKLKSKFRMCGGNTKRVGMALDLDESGI